MDKNHVRETLIFMTAMMMLVWVTSWSMRHASAAQGTGVDIAAVIAAVQVPATFYAKWAFEIFARVVK